MLDSLIEKACAKIAPTWPLDRFIAVNPFWERVETPMTEVAAELAVLSGARLLMPRTWFREERRHGRLKDEHLRMAIEKNDSATTVRALVALLDSPEPVIERRARVMDVVDGQRDLSHRVAWSEFVLHSTSQYCASYFDESQAQLSPDREGGLYASWLRYALQDKSPSLLMGFLDYPTRVRALPKSARALAQAAMLALAVPEAERETYLTGLLLDVNGWASWCAYRRWTARLSGSDDGDLAELLAIRLAWEWMLHEAAGPVLVPRWRAEMATWPRLGAMAREAQKNDWLFQTASELAWQQHACTQLVSGLSAGRTPCSVQAVFCIDVRSEVFRRALENQDARVETLGFAGFFGLSVEYQPVGGRVPRPQLPGLLAATLRVEDSGTSPAVGQRRAERLGAQEGWKRFTANPVASFVCVETLGLFYAGKLLDECLHLLPAKRHEAAGLTAAEDAARRPRLATFVDERVLGEADRTRLAESILRGMGLTRDFARLVVLVGHGGQTRNNPLAAGLDCGACCGQTGEVNSRAAAALLNEPRVRSGLEARGIQIPASTWFLAGQHDTTTDAARLYELDAVPPSHHDEVAAFQRVLASAGDEARRERAGKLGLDGVNPTRLLAAVHAKARDWAETRPEWGLAGNAAFIVAPREHSRRVNFEGRAFLHDYRFERDKDFSILEALMTAPMVVSHWINMQYYASTVDNPRYGSGDKTLHNVVGGRLGVFEGNGGDLRIGLPLQSLHDGTRWLHSPLRLSVFIEAPTHAIEAIVSKHAKVRALVENEWLFLFQLDAASQSIHSWKASKWVDVSGVDAAQPDLYLRAASNY